MKKFFCAVLKSSLVFTFRRNILIAGVVLKSILIFDTISLGILNIHQLLALHEGRRRAPKQRWPADPCCMPGLYHRVLGRDRPPAFVTVMPAREPKTRTSALHTTAGPNARTSTSIVSPTTCKSVVAGLSPRSRDDTALAGLRNGNQGGGLNGVAGADEAAAQP